MTAKHGVADHEKKLVQLFCDNGAQDVINMLLSAGVDVSAEVANNVTVENLCRFDSSLFGLKTSRGEIEAESMVIAGEGLSIPKNRREGLWL